MDRYRAATAKLAVIATETIVDRYRAATAKLAAGSDDESDGVQQKPLEDSNCPVCFEALADGRPVVSCKEQCGNNIHAECFTQWEKSRRAMVAQLTCIYCRSPWPVADGMTSLRGDEGYVNVATATNLSRHRGWSCPFNVR
ncbi:hypothetical protein H310_02905 [Aphanomyces invadans]|uniref:RING-type domain-containing protein n=1 Tax=Aphanomyces invadans TaxID=157072 RepID=A0A024UKM4_9STRA|nr:hypothetical protein H310_02905 [Aphanomyces invadans]ETW06740.1 hypothetical protein H310_02905 [Aphanomyces invadans]|eukprot:XP_008864815.1 hypothetical protein H310_02905 [Aphanomyces invadans]